MLGPSADFSKTFTYYCSAEMGLHSDREKSHFLPIPTVPHAEKQKTAALLNSGWFLSLGGGASRFLGGGVISLQDPLAPLQNSNSM